MEQIIFEKSHIGRVILSYLSSKDLLQFRLVSHKANKLASSDDVWKDKLINKYGQEIFSVPHNRPSLFKLYLELDTDCKSVLNLIKQGDLFYLHWMNLNDTPFNEWDISYSEKHGTQEITEWLTTVATNFQAKLRVQSIDNDLFLERKYHLCIKSIGGGQFLCLGVKGLDGIQPLDQDTINICESYHLPYISNRG